MLSRTARVNERGMFEKPRWIAVGIRFGESEGRRRDCKERQGDEKGFTAERMCRRRDHLREPKQKERTFSSLPPDSVSDGLLRKSARGGRR